jgi:hypothetical protein
VLRQPVQLGLTSRGTRMAHNSTPDFPAIASHSNGELVEVATGDMPGGGTYFLTSDQPVPLTHGKDTAALLELDATGSTLFLGSILSRSPSLSTSLAPLLSTSLASESMTSLESTGFDMLDVD